MKKLYIFLIIIALVGAGFVINLSQKSNNTDSSKQLPDTSNINNVNIGNNIDENSNTKKTDIASQNTDNSNQKQFNITGSNFKYNLSEIRVKKGDNVKIVFTNTEGSHDLVIDEFNVRTPQIKAGEKSTIDFIADKSGTFEYYCSIGNHRQMGMKGQLTVEE